MLLTDSYLLPPVHYSVCRSVRFPPLAEEHAPTNDHLLCSYQFVSTNLYTFDSVRYLSLAEDNGDGAAIATTDCNSGGQKSRRTGDELTPAISYFVRRSDGCMELLHMSRPLRRILQPWSVMVASQWTRRRGGVEGWRACVGLGRQNL